MALSYVTYAGDAATTNFSVTFSYIQQSHVKVYLDGVLKTVTTDYTWFNPTTIQFLVAPGAGVVVRIERETTNTARLVDFQDAGNLTEYDLDTSADQLFYLVQEAQDDFTDLALSLDTDDKWNAESKIIKNVADPVADQDAATKLWSITAGNTALAAALVAQAAAEAAQTAAELAETNAAASETATAADLVQTNLDQISCAANATLTAADVISTNADAASTAADVLLTAADVVSTNADAAATAADLVQTNLDQISCDADATAAAASAVAAAASAASVDVSEFRNRRNLITNGCFRVWQRGDTFNLISSGAYSADQWLWTNNTAGAANIVRNKFSSTSFLTKNRLDVDISTAHASMAAGEYAYVQQNIEAVDIHDVKMGNAAARDLVLTFYHTHTKTGTHSVAVRNSAGNRSYVAEYTQSVADTAELATIVIPGDTVGTWLTEPGTVGLRLTFCLAVGSTFSTTAGSWSGGNYLGSSSQVNNLDNTANYFRIHEVQLESVDSGTTTATNFESRSFNEELSLCERYYEKSYELAAYAGDVDSNGIEVALLTGLNTAAKTYGTNVRFRTPKSVNPTVTTYSPNTGTSGKAYDYTATADINTTVSVQSETGFKWQATTASAANINLATQWVAVASL